MSEKGTPVIVTYEITRDDKKAGLIRVYKFAAEDRVIAVATYNAWRGSGETVSFSTIMTSVERYTTMDEVKP